MTTCEHCYWCTRATGGPVYHEPGACGRYRHTGLTLEDHARRNRALAERAGIPLGDGAADLIPAETKAKLAEEIFGAPRRPPL